MTEKTARNDMPKDIKIFFARRFDTCETEVFRA